ncbi:MAG: hypothetical protein G01um101448_1173 [Parcubacteria group bacterium Gr01-1014_48]|nr:MAG: hypothetical protein Greene041614_1181 [Parcubacteria group bacterium Greene0416_14]TSC71450.1 MAG: hypothetical protein G01um101448_1173 [Parcubacteria group bacterium Gr01-1014_48]TSC99145.1 MAG: hypothetical protein Greene101415_1182 [Parcubacteria group bacterium Greene1014_15]
MPVGYTEGPTDPRHEHQYSDDDSMTFALIGVLACGLLTLTLTASALGILLFSAPVISALQGTLATHPINMLGSDPIMQSLIVVSLVFFFGISVFKADTWGEKIAGKELREKRYIKAIEAGRRATNVRHINMRHIRKPR